jgi:LPXTG-site transpeptidase (sortase) family protein
MIAANKSQTWLNFLRKHVLLVAAIAVHLLSVGGLVYARQAPDSASAPVSLPAESSFPVPTISGIPTEISIPSVNIQLSVLPGVYDKTTDEWTLSGYNAHFATVTRPANNAGGNTFIYGHNNRHVFGPIKKIAPGAEARVVTDVGNVFYYSLVGSKTVDPSDVSLFTYTGAPILTIQTCTGAWHEQRQLYTFKLERVEESKQSVAIRDEAQRQVLVQTVAAVINPSFQLAAPPPVESPAPVFAAAPPEPQKQQVSIPVALSSLMNTEKPLFAEIL